MPGEPKKIRAAFYRTAQGTEPVRAWLLECSPADRKTIGVDIARVEFGWPIGMPTCRPMGGGLWEIRSDISGGRIARVLFCVADGTLVLLHAFAKKTQKTPPSDLALARSRQKEACR